MKTILSLLLLLGAQARAQQAFDAKAVLAEAKESASEAVSIEPAAAGLTRRYDSDCVRFTFGADDAPVSEAVWLRSTEWVEECVWTGDPRHGGGRQCWERPGYSYNERVQVTLKDRKKLYPWETDSFRVCLQGPWLDATQLATAYDYRMVSGGNRNGNLVLTPGNKRQMKPDASAITGQVQSDGTLKLSDRWASHYAGEKLVLKLKVNREIRNWPDSTVGEKELELSAVPASVDLKEFAKLEAGKRYYVKIEFKRVGSISKADWVSGGKTPAAPYQPSLFARLD